MRLIAALALLSLPAAADGLAPGAYRVEVRTLIPHVATAATRTLRLCWTGDDPATLGPLAAAPLAACPAVAVADRDTPLTVTTTCPGANAATAIARYRPTPTGFRGRVDIDLGGKNMTLTEIQTATRLGPCTE